MNPFRDHPLASKDTERTVTRLHHTSLWLNGFSACATPRVGWIPDAEIPKPKVMWWCEPYGVCLGREGRNAEGTHRGAASEASRRQEGARSVASPRAKNA